MKASALAFSALVLGLAGCATTAAPVASPATGSLTGRSWQLVELNGQPVPASARMPYITFSESDHRVSGNSGCNGFGGSYESEGLRIRFKEVMHTMMACMQGMDTETGFMNVLDTADNYSLSGDTLTLNKARMAPLARFTAVVAPPEQ